MLPELTFQLPISWLKELAPSNILLKLLPELTSQLVIFELKEFLLENKLEKSEIDDTFHVLISPYKLSAELLSDIHRFTASRRFNLLKK